MPTIEVIDREIDSLIRVAHELVSRVAAIEISRNNFHSEGHAGIVDRGWRF